MEKGRYHAIPVTTPGEPAVLRASNPRQRYVTAFRAEGIELASRREAAAGTDWRLGVRVTGFGPEGDVRPIGAAEPVARDGRVEYLRGPVTEWYENRPGGLEQGFTIAEAPAKGDRRSLAIELAVESGLSVTIGKDGASFADPSGRTVVRYAGLRAWDADGHDLPSRMESAEGGLRLVVEAERACFPVTVDPVFVQEAQLRGTGDPIGTAGDNFGFSVSVSGDTAVVGALNHSTMTAAGMGAAYVFVRSGTVWTEQQKLTASDGAANDSFGWSVSVSGDTAVVGAPYHNTAGGGNAGAAWVFVRSGTVWTEQQKLTASDGAVSDYFGVSVSISGDTAVVGAYGDDAASVTDAGSAYVFVRSGTTWSQQQKLVAADGAAGDFFGWSSSVSGETIVVGAPYDDTPAGADAGSAYVFVRSGTTWSQQQKLVAADGAATDTFGYSVSVSGDTAVVGAPWDDLASTADAGSAHVFVRSGTVWTLQQKLTADDGAAYDWFGSAVSISGETAVVGSYRDDTARGTDTGSAYVFVRSGAAWGQQKIVASGGTEGDNFGQAVSVSGDTALIGTPYHDTLAGPSAGSAYVFVGSGGSWSEQQMLVASEEGVFDRLGHSVSVSGDTAVVGAPYDDTTAGANAGAAYVFVRSGTLWSRQQKLTAPDGAADDSFGWSVSVSGDTTLIGAPWSDTPAGADAGAAYVFVRSGTIWSQQQKLTASDGAASDFFGTSVSVSGNTAVIGAPFHDTAGGADAGAAYVSVRSGTVWTEQQKLTASDGAGIDNFGQSVSVSGETALVGAPFDDTLAGTDTGSAYVFVRSGAAWSEQQKLAAADAEAGDRFGSSVSLSGDTAVAGASYDDTTAGANAGSAYVFVRTGTAWSQQRRLEAPDGAPGDFFGSSVAGSDDTVAVGAPFAHTPAGSDAGSAYVFVRTGTTWSMEQKLTASDGAPSDRFCWSVSVSGDRVAVGTPFDHTAAGADAGTAYVFRLEGDLIFRDGFE